MVHLLAARLAAGSCTCEEALMAQWLVMTVGVLAFCGLLTLVVAVLRRYPGGFQ